LGCIIVSEPATSRRRFAEELRATAHLTSDGLVDAFARVPRERFVGHGPWQICIFADDGSWSYRTTDSADPIHVYDDVLIGIDSARGLNNGEPSSLAAWIESLALRSGETVVHIGSGTGYYTAILAELVGPSGIVLACEIEPVLAARAEENLRPWNQVTVSSMDGCELPFGECDAIFVNCGVTHPLLAWLTRLRMNGRLLLPVTASSNETGIGRGAMFLITRRAIGFAVRYLSPVGIFSCLGGRSEALNQALLDKTKESWRNVQSVRIDQHVEDHSCWLHTDLCCLSESPAQAHAA
jgi:protein-L-isoaspartate(D-aspartate) O-methyltransferase